MTTNKPSATAAAAVPANKNDDVISIASGGDDGDVIEWSKWPESNPHYDSPHVISVVCGNSRYHWAIHDGYDKDYFPLLFWKTTPLESPLDANEDTLSKYLPPRAYEMLGGPSFKEEPTTAKLIQHITKQRIPCFHIYMVVTNEDSFEEIPNLFANLPCRFIRMQAVDFLEDAYVGAGADRCANLRAAKHLYGNPALVIDGGTAMTWSASDEKGQFRGGGITPGLGMKFRAMHENTGKLPFLGNYQVTERLKQCMDSEKPLDTFPTNTVDAMCVGVLRETALNLCALTKVWVDKTKTYFEQNPQPEKEGEQDEKGKTNEELHVCLTGGDAEVLEQLLMPNHSHILEVTTSDVPTGAKIVRHKNMSSHAIGHVLMEKYVSREKLSPLEVMRHDLMGLRVLNDTVRGTIYDLQRGDDIAKDSCKVKYDDGSDDLVDPATLYGYLMAFHKSGEDSSFADLEDEGRENHKKIALGGAEKLVEMVPAIKSLTTATNKRPLATDSATPGGGSNKKAKTGGPSAQELKEIALGTRKTTPKSAARNLSSSKKKAGVPAVTPKPTKKNVLANPLLFVKRRVSKYFDKDLYFGVVDSYISPDESMGEGPLWHVIYDDGDNEDYDASDMVTQMKDYEVNKEKDAKKK
eukprot:CAMPEP_0198155212 /NCGR_PEP_ID=MMETSP1443-20131203/69017_1 /TAXON_ID=186043 /ORGANISM="Entomoneis sp., Strain CCMP2396" /LENGTH=635 /DNA_ID=CAMNT_0043821953 /DNA_START=179 /DNA_END=2086 /DNA_ORIENTATION=+